ncbi:MAG: HEAT repeat domain-containing protein [Planctomycetota bacterium]
MKSFFKHLSAFIIMALALTNASGESQDTNSQMEYFWEPNAVASLQQLVPLLKSKTTPKKERLQALHTMYKAKESLSKAEQIELLQSAKTVAEDKQDDAQLRTDAIWVMNGIGMKLKHEKTLTDEDISREFQFLLQMAADESENLHIRRMSITATGDLKMKEAIPIVKVLLADGNNLNRPEIARSASIALAELEPNEAVQPVGQILSNTTDPAVFGTAAYALGRTKSLSE